MENESPLHECAWIPGPTMRMIASFMALPCSCHRHDQLCFVVAIAFVDGWFTFNSNAKEGVEEVQGA